jgi:hypothetical protein
MTTTKIKRPRKWPENEDRFRELILYICQKCATHSRFGATKLNKLLYFCDFMAYLRLGDPITGFEYQREKNGPVPTRLVPFREQMKKAGELAIQPVRLPDGRIQLRHVNLREPKLEVFSSKQMALIDEMIEYLKNKDAEAVSDLTHTMVGWQVVDPGEQIPYETAFVSTGPPSEADIVRAKEFARERSEHGRQ